MDSILQAVIGLSVVLVIFFAIYYATKENMIPQQYLYSDSKTYISGQIADALNYKLITLKDVECGVIRVDKLFVKEMCLRTGFTEQGISKELVESYYFC